MDKRKRNGFTLIELLVVISIIALLMSILIPALARVRKQAKAVMCQSNLKQWGIIWSMYTGDHDGYFPPRGGNPTIPASGKEGYWILALKGYLAEGDYSLWLCPMATKTWEEGGTGSLMAWSHYQSEPPFPDDAIGSYAINSWVYNYEGTDPDSLKSYWKTANVRGANNIPVFVAGNYPGANPEDTSMAPSYAGDESTPGKMDHVCFDRHDGAENGVFMDWSVRRIPLKCLWKLKWSRDYDINADTTVPDWESEAPWMKRFPECDY